MLIFERDSIDLSGYDAVQGSRCRSGCLRSKTLEYQARFANIVADVRAKELCSAQIQDFSAFGDAVVPYKLVLNWPAEHQLSMKLNKPDQPFAA